MKILVTGREGQLARSLVERGTRAGFSLIAVGRPELDLERPESIAPAIAAAAPDVVINAAAYTAVDHAEDQPELAARINGEAAGEVAAAARRAGARVVQISTDYVFDGAASEPYDEGAPTRPLGAYGRSKLEGEEAVRAANSDHTIVRTAWVYSPFGRNFVKTMLDLARTRDTISVVADQRGNPSSALDLADGLLALLSGWRSEPERGKGEIYHLAGTGSTSWDMFARQIFAEAEKLGAPSAEVRSIRTEDYPTKATRPRSSRLDCSKFERDFGYRAPAWQISAAQVVGRLVSHDG
jgi:dTDP-4-dehydrorhamnose reductase